jgi:hypothetical protein
MGQLSSCYFCGTALDEPVGTYRLGGDDAGETVTLCAGCAEKLDTLLDAAAVDGEVRSENGAEQSADEDSDDGRSTISTVVETTNSTTADEESADDILVDLGTDDAVDGDAESDTADSSETAEPEPEPDLAGGFETKESSADGDDSVGIEDSDAEDGEAGRDDAAAGAESAEDAIRQSQLSRREFNKVIRLLQNREFPVDRQEFVIVASNAYDLGRSECGAVIDLAIERGIIAEEDGQLLRAE